MIAFGELSISFTSRLWVWQGKGAWFFVTLPAGSADEVRFFASDQMAGRRRGFGSLRVQASIGEAANQSRWQTSIFPDKTSGSYLLPIKAAIRQSQGLHEGDEVTVHITLIE